MWLLSFVIYLLSQEMAIETGQSDFNIIGKKNFHTLPSGPQFFRIRLLFIPFKARKSEAALNSSMNA